MNGIDAATQLSAGLRKPLDLGNGNVAASFGGDGSWLSLGTPHPVHGFVELSGAPPFEEADRGDPAAVRQHRGRLIEERFAFLRLELPEEDVTRRRADVDGSGRLTWERVGRGWSCSATAEASAHEPALVQRYVIAVTPGSSVALRFGGRLDRCALAEITEVDPPEPLAVHSEARVRDGELHVVTGELESRTRISVQAPNGGWEPHPDGGMRWEVRADAAQTVPLEITVTASLDAPAWPGERSNHVPVPTVAQRDPADGLDRIASGALRYILGCTALDVGSGERTILTDHRLLPLSWTRDAYYQALLLLRVAPHDREVTGVVAAHLRWLWGRGRVPGRPWMRSHLPDGRPKDLAVQADQQLYPLLELADYRRVTGRWPDFPAFPGRADTGTDLARRWGALADEVWRTLPRHGEDGLLAGAENPADDPSELPFTLSTQILYWHTAVQLAPYEAELGLDAWQLAQTAERLHDAVERSFACDGPFGTQWAYETDGAGNHRLYQDANDLPTAFAPRWGFCTAADECWSATMRFAFSPHNPGYVSGPYGGLGSAHTPGTWTLGDAQEIAVADATGDKARAAAVRERINRVAGVDGLLPETYHADTADWLARHWFAWPSAVLGVLHLDITGR